eukprot:1190449-Prorocentrum_minimum.AAC.1
MSQNSAVRAFYYFIRHPAAAAGHMVGKKCSGMLADRATHNSDFVRSALRLAVSRGHHQPPAATQLCRARPVVTAGNPARHPLARSVTPPR